MVLYSINRSYLFFMAITFFLYDSNNSQFIRPIKTGLKADKRGTMALKDTISLFEMIESRSIIKIDLNRPLRQQAIVIRNSKSVKLNLFCSINIPPSVKKADIITQFCYQRSISEEATCSDLIETKSNVILYNMKIVVANIIKGFNITLDSSASGDHDLSGFYYCKSSSTSSGVVLSNIMEIRDLIYWGRNLVISQPESVHQKYQNNFQASEMPKTFECIDQVQSHLAKDFPPWMDLEFKSIAKWAWCPVSKQRPNLMELEKTYIEDCLTLTHSKCHKPVYLCPYDSGKMPGWKAFISFYGSITLISGQNFQDYGNKLDGYALMCYYKSRDNFRALRYIANDFSSTQLIKGLKWVNEVNNRSTFEIISPLNQKIHVGILKKSFMLTAFYYSPTKSNFEWTHKGNVMYNSTDWIVTPYSLQYRNTIKLENEGEYQLQVTHYTQQIMFTFDVIVSSPPLLVNTSVPTILSSIYAMSGLNLSITYRYKARPTDVNLYINGLVYKPERSDHAVFMKDLTKTHFYLKGLNFNLTVRNTPNNIVEVTYIASKLLFSDIIMRAQDHSLIVEAVNQYGMSRSHLNINVLKFPTYISLPSSDNCSVQCSSRQPHLFHCEINDEYYTNREVVVEKFWTVNGIRLNSLPSYSSYFENDSKGLYMRPINSTKSEQDIALRLLFRDAKLVCRIRLLYPSSLGLLEKDLINEKRIIFDSINDPYFVSHSTVQVRLDWGESLATASHTWIIFLVIALVLIMLFVFLLVRLTLRDQGGSYQIEKLEMAKGINRDEEIIENETITPYMRSDNIGNGINSSASKSFLPGYQPREVLDIIDDENETEIDNEHDLEDPNKFNEEGSFIGIYSSKN